MTRSSELSSTHAIRLAQSIILQAIVARATTTIPISAIQVHTVNQRKVFVRMHTALVNQTQKVHSNKALTLFSVRRPDVDIYHSLRRWVSGDLLSRRPFNKHYKHDENAARAAFADGARFGKLMVIGRVGFELF